MLRAWEYNESLSVPGILSTKSKKYWVKIIAIPQKWWSRREWKRANDFLALTLKEAK